MEKEQILNRKAVSTGLIVLGSVLITAALGLMVLWMTGVIDDGSGGYSSIETGSAFGDLENYDPPPPPPVTGPPPSEAPIARLVVPRASIDAPVVVRGLDGDGVMESPDNAYDTAWYDFSSRPGFPGNAVFSGHVDYIRVGPAVFWGLRNLEQGDTVEIQLNDGTTYRYAVSFKQQFNAETAPVQDIVGPTEKETVTMITCGGTFSSASGQYDQRLVVRAERVADTLPPPTGAIAE